MCCIVGDNEALIPADVFFAKIMEDTDTYITWPNKLKIGAKSKKGMRNHVFID